jgi:hypothetical protein
MSDNKHRKGNKKRCKFSPVQIEYTNATIYLASSRTWLKNPMSAKGKGKKVVIDKFVGIVR